MGRPVRGGVRAHRKRAAHLYVGHGARGGAAGDRGRARQWAAAAHHGDHVRTRRCGGRARYRRRWGDHSHDMAAAQGAPHIACPQRGRPVSVLAFVGSGEDVVESNPASRGSVEPVRSMTGERQQVVVHLVLARYRRRIRMFGDHHTTTGSRPGRQHHGCWVIASGPSGGDLHVPRACAGSLGQVGAGGDVGRAGIV